jgi:phosphopantetheine--protein transferase-like protein
MPLVYQQNINLSTRLGIWHIREPEDFFLEWVPLQREITHPNKRLQHLAGRFLLKELFADFPYDLIKIADTRKPFLQNEAYHFSISHCGAYAAAIVSKELRVGVDVELFTSKVEKIAHKFLSASELEMITAFANLHKIYSIHQLLTTAWSIKESLYKWFGDGQVEFDEHLLIQKIDIGENEGNATCKFLKETSIDLKVHFLFFNNNCLSWVMS